MPGVSRRVFFSYSHQDEALLDELANHLSILTWHDRKRSSVGDWDHQINDNLNTADIILLPPMLAEIRRKIADDQFEFSKHAVDQSILRGIHLQEIKQAIANGQVIEDYPDDKYGPTCLISGLTQANRPLHVQCSYPSRSLIKIITVYEPNSNLWNNDFTRRRSNDEQ
ncbi:DUF4258 domain-containing protein [Nostoc sp. NOS(2021)]|uniref:DUF4258 domain-containing protein n=1 Tax=Nostoc sp. NOS(2021) TaxID=2815407 RepID=UPI0025F1CC6E|nr:DUF4258 domain-containing protein [Nostoc sp. NOS(2021)]